MFSGVCCAQDEMATKLTLADAVLQVLGAHANIKQAEESRLSSLSDLRIAGFTTTYGVGARTSFDRDPDDSGILGLAYGDLTYESLFGTQATLEFSPFGLGTERGAVGLTVRHPLTSGKGALSTKSYLLAGARSNATIQQKELYLTIQSTVLNVVEAYYDAVLAAKQVKVQERAVSIAEEAADGARRRADEGLVAGIEVSRAEIRVARTRDQLNVQQQSARAAVDRLMFAMGSGVGHNVELIDDLPEEPVDIPDLPSSIKTALSNRAEFAVYDERLVSEQRELDFVNDQLQPKLDIVAGFNSVDDNGGLISSSLLSRSDLRVGVELNIPLDKRIDQEKADTSARQLDLIQKLRSYQMEQVVEQVRRAYRNMESSQATLDILSENVKVAEENLRLAKRMVEEGIEDNRVVLEAQDSLTQVESGLLSAKTDIYLAGMNLRYAMGQDLTEIVTVSK